MSGKAIGEVSLVRRAVFWDYLELTKPELTGLSVVTAMCGYYLGASAVELASLVWTAAGTILVGGGAGALNQLMEKRYDAMMKRTERRPLPSGRLEAGEVAIFGTLMSIAGVLILLLALNTITAVLGVLTLLSYLFVYTPSKRITRHSTLIGAVPGALPPVMGWTAATGTLTMGGWILFAILFLWQIPHFLALAWMYRKDYARAGYRVLTVLDDRGKHTGIYILAACVLLIPASLSAAVFDVAGWWYGAGAILLSAAFLLPSVRFLLAAHGTISHAAQANRFSRHVFFGSLLYLPALMVFMIVDKI